MKLHKFVVYVIDFEDTGAQNITPNIKNSVAGLADVFEQGTGDIGEWTDSHPLNFTTATQQMFDQYIKTDH